MLRGQWSGPPARAEGAAGRRGGGPAVLRAAGVWSACGLGLALRSEAVSGMCRRRGRVPDPGSATWHSSSAAGRGTAARRRRQPRPAPIATPEIPVRLTVWPLLGHGRRPGAAASAHGLSARRQPSAAWASVPGARSCPASDSYSSGRYSGPVLLRLVRDSASALTRNCGCAPAPPDGRPRYPCSSAPAARLGPAAWEGFSPWPRRPAPGAQPWSRWVGRGFAAAGGSWPQGPGVARRGVGLCSRPVRGVGSVGDVDWRGASAGMATARGGVASAACGGSG